MGDVKAGAAIGPRPADAPFGPARRGLTVGLLLAVTVHALTALAIVTIAPRIPAELGDLGLYGWVFSGFMLASLLGTVWGGSAADRRGPRLPFAVGLTTFAVGLLAAGLAPSMTWIVLARVAQGFGAGASVTCVYAVVTRSYPDAQRPRLMAYLSTAWVAPALVGPALAGVVAETVGWRWVFLGLAPALGLVAALTLPRFTHLPSAAGLGGLARRALVPASGAVGGLALALAALSSASGGGAPGWTRSLALGAVGVAGAVVAACGLRQLLPAGTLRLAPGLGALVAARGGFFAAFVGVEAFLALMLTDLHGLSSAATGAVIASGAIAWAAGSWWQARRDRADARGADRGRRVAGSTLVLGLGLGLQGLALAGAGVAGPAVVAVAVVGWVTAGLGIGSAHATSSVLAFALAEADGLEAGRVSAALQLSDNVGAALSSGLGGAALAFVAAGGGEAALRAGVAAAFAVAWGAWLLSYAASLRNAPRQRSRRAPG